jgi:hypothetical protein
MSGTPVDSCGTGAVLSTPLGSNWIPPTGAASTTVADVIVALSGAIDQTLLAQALKAEIALIPVLRTDLLTETASRLNDNGALSLLLSEVQDGVAEAQTLVYAETQQRITADSAAIASFNVMAAALGGAIATHTTALDLLVTADTAAALITTQLAASLVTDLGLIRSSITSVETASVTRDSANTALTNQVASSFATRAGAIEASVTTERNARTTADFSLATSIQTTQSNLGNQIASVQETSTTNINAVTGVVNALYTAKVDVNGLVGGFGLTNNGAFVDAGFNVDRFWVGRTNANKVKPFVIRNGVTEIDSAVIGTASITNAKIADAAITTAKIGDLAVDTIKIAGNAVTIPVGNFTEGAAYVNPGVWTTMQLSALNSSGSPIIIIATAFPISVYGEVGGSQTVTSPELRISCNDVEIYRLSGSVSFVHQPGAGFKSYKIEARGASGTGASHRSLVLLEAKK